MRSIEPLGKRLWSKIEFKQFVTVCREPSLVAAMRGRKPPAKSLGRMAPELPSWRLNLRAHLGRLLTDEVYQSSVFASQ